MKWDKRDDVCVTMLPHLSTEGERHAEVANPRLDTCSREVFRHEVRRRGGKVDSFVPRLSPQRACMGMRLGGR